MLGDGKSVGHELGEGGNGKPGHEDTCSATQDGEHDAFRDELPNNPLPPGAEGGAHGDFAAAAYGTGQQ